MKEIDIRSIELQEWIEKPYINPSTYRKIKINRPLYNIFLQYIKTKKCDILHNLFSKEEEEKKNNNYKKITLLGKGSEGEVWKAINENNNKLCALKIFKKKKSWQYETFIYTQLRDIPCIPDFYTSFLCPSSRDCRKNNYFISTALYDTSLYHFIRNRNKENQKLNINEIKYIFGAIAKTIQNMHNKGFTHHDIRSTNILCNIYHNPKDENDKNDKIIDVGLIDFGCVFCQDVKNSYVMLNKEQCIVRSEYPPEDIYNMFYTKPELWDIYQLGALLLYIITGKYYAYKNEMSNITPLDPQLNNLYRLSLDCMGYSCLIEKKRILQPSIEEIIQRVK